MKDNLTERTPMEPQRFQERQVAYRNPLRSLRLGGEKKVFAVESGMRSAMEHGL
jgi:hypothetical protein